MASQIHRCEFEPTSKPVTSPVTKLGGRPVFLSAIEWPVCAQCGTAMLFLAQFSLEKPFDFKVPFAMAYVFLCPNGESCDTAHPEGGANAVVLQRKARSILGTKTVTVEPPAPLFPEWGCSIKKVRHSIEEDGEVSKVAGQPDWIQDDETPQCPGCGEGMTFVAQMLAELPEPVAIPQAQIPKLKSQEALAAIEQAARNSPDGTLKFTTCELAGRNAIGINGTFIGTVRVEDTFPITLHVLQLAKQLEREVEMQVAGQSKYFLPFGDAGIGYVFLCQACPEGRGAFLWQTT